MLAACLLLASLLALSAGDYYQPEFSPKNLRMYYFARKIQPSYHERMYYPMKPAFKRPYMVYVPKPYVVEVPKPVPYVKLPVSQQYHFEKQLHPYKIEKPFYLHQLPTSLEGKVPIDVKVPVESPVSVTVEKQVLLPVNLDGEKQTESKQPSKYVSLPQEVTSHLELAMNKERSPLSGFEKDSFLEQLKANGFTQESLRSQFLSQGEHKPSSIVTEFPNSWSSESLAALKPIVVSEESQKWNSLNGSEWVPRFELSNIQTTSNDKYKFLKSGNDHFEINGEKYQIKNSKLPQDISKYLFPEKSNFVPSPSIEPVTTLKEISFGQSFLSEQPSKPSFELPSSKNYQFYNIDSGNIIKPEALTSNGEIAKVETDLKEGTVPSYKWLISNGYHKDSQNTIPEQSETNIKWLSTQESYAKENEPTNKWQSSSEQYLLRREPAEQQLKEQGRYESQKELSLQWPSSEHQGKDQPEPNSKWTNAHGQYIVKNDSDNFETQQKDHSEPTIKWVKNGDQYIIQKKPGQQWLKSQDTYYVSSEYRPQTGTQEEQVIKLSEDQSKNQQAYSSQKFLLSPQYVSDNKDTLQQEKYEPQEKTNFHFSQQLEGSFKPLIPSRSQISYKYEIPHSETQLSQSNFPHRQQYFEQKPEQASSQTENPFQQQSSGVQTQNYQPSKVEKQIHHRQKDTLLKSENPQPTSSTNYQQYFRNHQYFQRSQDVQSKPTDAHHSQESSVHSYPQYAPSSKQSGDYRQQHTVYQHNTEVGDIEATSRNSGESQEAKTTYRPQVYIFGQKRRHRQPHRGETGVLEQSVRPSRYSTISTTEEPTTSVASSSTASQVRRKQRRKQKRRNQETTISPTEN